jgi:fermentation-respiration switch protein FrsA (DUF1100 family)
MVTHTQFPAAEVSVNTGDARLPGTLTLPAGACGVVAFAHGSGSSRFITRNRLVAQTLNQAGLATLLFDLHRVEIMRGATHLFEESGTLDTVAQLVSRWFVRYLRPPS